MKAVSVSDLMNGDNGKPSHDAWGREGATLLKV